MTRAARVSLLALVALVWGSTWLAIKVGLEDLPPFFAAGVRFAVAVPILALLSWVQGIPFPRERRVHQGLFALGILTFVVNYGAVYWGEQYLPSGLAAVLFATYPLFVLVLAHAIVEGERASVRRGMGVVVGFLGVAVIFRSDLAFTHPRAVAGAIVTLLAPLAAAISSVGIKKWGGHLHPYTLTMLPMTYGTVGLLAISLATGEIEAVRWTGPAVVSTAYLAVFGSVVGFVVYYRLLRDVAVSSLAMVSYVFPVVALTLGWIVLGERLDRWAAAGAALVVVGIALATGRRRRMPPSGEPEVAALCEPGPEPDRQRSRPSL